MPTVLSDHSDHLSLRSLSYSSHQGVPPFTQQGRPYPFPLHPHRPIGSQRPVRPSSPHGRTYPGTAVPEKRSKIRLSSSAKGVSFTRSSSSSSSKHPQHRHGPKWIHRHGKINGINYHWVETTNPSEDEGIKATDKPLVILLHGFPQFWYAWRHQIVPLAAAGYRVAAPDLRGFNLTDKPMGKDHAGYDMETLTDDVRELILHLGHSEANIVGHDWGGIIAWAFAARFPHHTTKLVVMNAPHLGRWRDVVTDYSSACCLQQAWWTCWYTLCCQLLPSWIPETALSYQRSWILKDSMVPSRPCVSSPLSCVSNPFTEGTVCATDASKPEGFPVPGGGGCSTCWKRTELDLYRDAISQPGAIHALLEYYRNLWLSVQQVEQYGKIHKDLPILVLWGIKDKCFPLETYAKGWEEWIDRKDSSNGLQRNKSSLLTVTYLDCGHFTPEEAPAEVNQQLLDFFQQPLPMLSAEV
jgi:epoxide hydrolase 4